MDFKVFKDFNVCYRAIFFGGLYGGGWLTMDDGTMGWGVRRRQYRVVVGVLTLQRQ